MSLIKAADSRYLSSPLHDGSVTRYNMHRIESMQLLLLQFHRNIVSSSTKNCTKEFHCGAISRNARTHAPHARKYVETVIILLFFLWKNFCRACELRISYIYAIRSIYSLLFFLSYVFNPLVIAFEIFR